MVYNDDGGFICKYNKMKDVKIGVFLSDMIFNLFFIR